MMDFPPVPVRDANLVLIVDDVPDNLAMLHDALDAAGYIVLVATSGEAALARAAQALPDIVLLDAMMPGMDGFEVARRLKADAHTAPIPIVFMTGLTETEHLIAALAAGGVDYVTKPIKPAEVLARMGVHLGTARRARAQQQQAVQARSALDAFGYASLTVRITDGRVLWQTPLARELLRRHLGLEGLRAVLPDDITSWIQRQQPTLALQLEPPRWTFDTGLGPVVLRLHPPSPEAEDGELLLVMREESDLAARETLRQGFGITAKEAEVLYWLAQGKINRDIADIVGCSPATVKKHLERIFAKLGVETRTAAAAMAMARLPA
ncbi:response regulator [Acidovorax sp. CCYZU-2555]|uniref:response regulator n=1 Tax=Acidovorax sp. CCYZU-2555 TaxID=2835042 RepID=UPI001BCB91AD|nr:response regulator [Acidovorax sp. CCYZU-2555]MBS7778087.1 response regulator transcription factor [Acidovorax sp. CCYZU-2555]